MSGATSRDERALDQVVESVVGLLEQAARGQHTAWALSEAMASIMAPRRGCVDARLSTAQRDRLLAAISAAYGTAKSTLPPLCRPSKLSTGMAALADIVVLWAECDEQRNNRHPHVHLDMHARARILRNELHNVSLNEEIEERSAQRRAVLIGSMLQTFSSLNP